MSLWPQCNICFGHCQVHDALNDITMTPPWCYNRGTYMSFQSLNQGWTYVSFQSSKGLRVRAANDIFVYILPWVRNGKALKWSIHTNMNVFVPVLSNIISFGCRSSVFTNVSLSPPSVHPLCILGNNPVIVQYKILQCTICYSINQDNKTNIQRNKVDMRMKEGEGEGY